ASVGVAAGVPELADRPARGDLGGGHGAWLERGGVCGNHLPRGPAGYPAGAGPRSARGWGAAVAALHRGDAAVAAAPAADRGYLRDDGRLPGVRPDLHADGR